MSFTVKNVGARAGSDVPQLYVDDPAAAGEPPKQLKGFQRVFLRRGRSVVVTLALDARALSQWDSTTRTWTVTPGLYRILVGASSRDIRLRGYIREP